jgi:hypothetical protein
MSAGGARRRGPRRPSASDLDIASQSGHPAEVEGRRRLELLSIQTFAGAANQEFALHLGEATIAVTLIEVKPLPPRAVPGAMREPFSLLFKSMSQIILPQKIYRLDNPTIGALDIFLVPVARDGTAVVYQAIFN